MMVYRWIHQHALRNCRPFWCIRLEYSVEDMFLLVRVGSWGMMMMLHAFHKRLFQSTFPSWKQRLLFRIIQVCLLYLPCICIMENQILRIVKVSGHLLVFFIMVADHSASWCSMTTTLISRVQVQDQHVYNDINYSKRLLVPTHL